MTVQQLDLLKKWLALPQPEAEEDQYRLDLLLAACLILGIALAFYGFFLVWWQGPLLPYSLRIIVILALLVLLMFLLLRLGRVRVAGHFFLAGSWLFMTLLPFWLPVTQLFVLTYYFVVICVATLLYGGRVMLVYAGLTIGGTLFMLVNTEQNWLATATTVTFNAPTYVAVIVNLLLVVLLLYMALYKRLQLLRHTQADRAELLETRHLLEKRVNELNEVQEALRASEERLRTIVNHAPVIIFSLDQTGTFTMLEGHSINNYINHPERLIGRTIFDFGNNAPDLLRAFYQAMAGEMVRVTIDLPGGSLESWVYPFYDKEGQINGVLGVASDITALQLSEKQLRRSEQTFQDLINKTSVAYSTSDSLELVFQAVVEWLVDLLALEQSRIVLLDQDYETMRIVAERGLAERPSLLNQQLAIGNSIILQQVITSRAPLVINEPDFDKKRNHVLSVLFHAGVRAFMLVPLVVGTNTIGLIYCDTSIPRHFTSREIQLAQTVANLIATRIEQARLFESERQRRLEAETLQDATASLTVILEQDQVLNNILYHLERVIQYDTASVLLSEEEGLSIVAGRHFNQWPILVDEQLRHRNPLFNQLRKTRRPIIIDDVHQDDRFEVMEGFEYIRSWMGIPLIANERVIGYLGIDNKQLAAYAQHHALLAQAFANQAAIAITNARLFEQVQNQADTLQEVNESLRQEIAERRLLEDQIQQSLQRRTEQVYISTEVAQEIATAPALPILFRQVVHLIKHRFDYYHTQVYTLEGDYLIMQEGSGESGQIMKGEGHRISLRTEKSLVAQAATTGRPALATNVAKADNWLPNPLLPETKSELAVPIMLKDEVLGVLDVQSNSVAGISEEDNILLVGLCGQIAVAINNRRLDDRQAQAEAALQAYTVELERSNRELEDFAYIASHDLQEPLRKIQAFGNRLQQKYANELDQRGQDYLVRMESAAARMQALINDLLTFSRVTTRAQPFVEVDLNRLVQEVLQDLEVKIGEVNGRVHVDTLPTIEAEPTQMRQLLQNLISNALKFHRPNLAPLIHIHSEVLDEAPADMAQDAVPNIPYCRLFVADNGIGFDEKYLDRIFTVFQRLHGRSHYEGTGVGLALCRKIVERHQGTITAKSQVDQGATFIITLPMKQVRS
jgi:signal transduction histidine kinase/PAS domain-containing protein